MERLQKAIARSGFCSRRKAEELIEQGRVFVNGECISTPGFKVRGNDEIEVDGHRLKREEKVYFLINKPKGTITTTHDEHDRKTVLDYIDTDKRLYPVGRLDYDTSGALILTNDGDFTNKMLHPKFHVAKTYEVNLQGLLSNQDVEKLVRGFDSEFGHFAPSKVFIKSKDYKKGRTLLDLTIYEGQNHQVKNMMLALGHQVRKLHRSRFAGLDVRDLRPGESRRLKPYEIKQILRRSEGK